MNKQTVLKASKTVQDFLDEVDVDLVGIAPLSDIKDTRVRESALRLLPEAGSIVVSAMEIYPEILDHSRPRRTTGLASLNDLLDRNLDP